MTYREFVEHSKKLARNMRQEFTDPGDDWEPRFVADFPSEGRPFFGRLPMEAFESEMTKDMLVQAVMMATRELRPTKLALILSTWMVGFDKDSEAGREAARQVDSGEWPGASKHPDRYEALMLAVYDAERTEAWTARIERHRNRPPTLDAWEGPSVGPDDMAGRFANLQEAFR